MKICTLVGLQIINHKLQVQESSIGLSKPESSENDHMDTNSSMKSEEQQKPTDDISLNSGPLNSDQKLPIPDNEKEKRSPRSRKISSNSDHSPGRDVS